MGQPAMLFRIAGWPSPRVGGWLSTVHAEQPGAAAQRGEDCEHGPIDSRGGDCPPFVSGLPDRGSSACPNVGTACRPRATVSARTSRRLSRRRRSPGAGRRSLSLGAPATVGMSSRDRMVRHRQAASRRSCRAFLSRATGRIHLPVGRWCDGAAGAALVVWRHASPHQGARSPRSGRSLGGL